MGAQALINILDSITTQNRDNSLGKVVFNRIDSYVIDAGQVVRAGRVAYPVFFDLLFLLVLLLLVVLIFRFCEIELC